MLCLMMISTCLLVDYGIDLIASVSRENVFANQFHPEKSGIPGLKIVKNFVNLE